MVKQNNLIIRVKEVLREKTILQIIYYGIKLFLEYFYYKLFKSGAFKLNDKKFYYFYYPYNATWRNERAVEIPIICSKIKGYRGKDILELGNVLSHYFDVEHDILDKYEKVKGVINKDVIDFKPWKRYDLIVGISTLEHVGWDEKPKEPKKVLKAIKSLKKLLKKNGEIILTIPIGYNFELDKIIRTGKIKFKEKYYLKRISKDNRWREISEKGSEAIEYGKPFPKANGLFIGIIGNG